MSSFLNSLYILEISHLSDVKLAKKFPHSVGCHFVYLMCPLPYKSFSFRRSHLFIFAPIVCATGVLCRKWYPLPMCCRLLPTFSSITFNVVRLIFRSLIHLDVSFVHGFRYVSIFILIQVDIQLCQHHLLKIHSFFHCIILAPLSKIRCS